MKDLRLKGTCRTCKFWNPKFPGNKSLGACSVMGVHLWPAEGKGILPIDKNSMSAAINIRSWPDPMNPPSSDVKEVRTLDIFGCIHHDPGGE